MQTPKQIADEIDNGAAADIFYDADDYGDEGPSITIENFQLACAQGAAILRQLDAPEEWLVVITDEDGNRVDSETFGGDYSIEQIREVAGNHFGDLPAGHNCRFYPVGPERVDLAFGFSGDLPGTITLDSARDAFDHAASDLTAAQYLNEAAKYHRDGMIEDDTFQQIAKRVAEWLADEIELEA